MRDCLPPHHVVLEQADGVDGLVHQTVRVQDTDTEYMRTVHADEAYWEPEYTHDETYKTMLRHILRHGRDRPDRTGTGTCGVFGYQARFDLSAGYLPLLTTKSMDGRNWNNIVVELVWFLRGMTNIRFLLEHGVHIWTDWPLKHYNATMRGTNGFQPVDRATFEARILNEPDFAAEWGDCGPIYGAQWRAWTTGQLQHSHTDPHDHASHTIDQLQEVFNELAANPFSRRHIVSAWNPADLPAMIRSGLPPCHCLFQFNVRAMTLDERCAVARQHPSDYYGDKYPTTHDTCDQCAIPRYALDCQLYQRSADVFLGVPYNIVSYSLLTLIMAQQLGFAPGEFVHTFGDLHIYNNHRDQVAELLTRDPYPSPRVTITPRATLDEYEPADFVLSDYQSHPAIRAPVAV